VPNEPWTRRGPYCRRNAAGYRIAAASVGDAWRYVLFAPPLTECEFENRLKVRYAKGERVPQRRELLGVFDDPAAAQAAVPVGLQTSANPQSAAREEALT